MVTSLLIFIEWLFSRRPLAGMTIAGKMLAGYLVLAALTVGVVSYVLASIHRINDLGNAVITVDVPMQTATSKMMDAVLAQNNYEKRYLILRRKDLRHFFWERAKEFDVSLAEMKRLGQREHARLVTLERLHARYGDLFLTMSEHVREGKIRTAEALSNGEMGNDVQKILDVLGMLLPRAKASQDARMKAIDADTGSAFRTTVALCAISTAFSLLSSFIITIYISHTFNRLKKAADHVADGRFDHESGIRSDDELGDLARSFDEMKIRLHKHEEMYRDASPLTRLPGGTAIENEVKRRLALTDPMAVCVMDIDNFKSFNDRYGYAHGNVVIKDTARIVEHAVRTHGRPGDFVGHIGGDDFVAVTVPAHIEALCKEIIEQFDRNAPNYYNDDDRRKGFIHGKNRQGEEMKFPLMTISFAVVTNRIRAFANPLEVAEVAAELKDYAKTFPRSLYVVDKRRDEKGQTPADTAS